MVVDVDVHCPELMCWPDSGKMATPNLPLPQEERLHSESKQHSGKRSRDRSSKALTVQ